MSVLVDEGYRAATTSRIQRAAGVSRGALLHHFPTRHVLLLAATRHLAVRRGRWLADRAAAIDDGADRIDATISLLWDTMNGPLFAAATELWIAARTDEALRRELVVHERRLGVEARHHLAAAMRLPDPDAPALVAALDQTLQVLRGAALTALLRDDARWERDVVALATQTFRDRLAVTEPGRLPIDAAQPRTA